MRGRKRRTRYSWFPVLGQEADTLTAGEFYAPATDELVVTVGDPAPLVLISLTWDYPVEVETTVGQGIPSLADFQGSEYQLERIVGKFFAYARKEPAQGEPPQPDAIFAVAAALIILKVEEDSGAPLRADLGEYSPFTADNISDPWIWRRTWILAQAGNQPTQATIYYLKYDEKFPRSTAFFGDIESGPHVDSRSVRKVRKEERVFLVVQAMALDNVLAPRVPNEGEGRLSVPFMFDYRILGRLVKASAHGNTSR